MATKELKTTISDFHILPRRVEVPMFEIQSNPTIQMSVLKTRRYLREKCPICNEYFDDVIEHALELGDDDHKTLGVVGI